MFITGRWGCSVTVTVFRGRCCQRQNNPPPVFPSFPLWNARKPGPRRRCVEGSSTDRTNACVYWDSLCEPGSPFRFLLSRSSAHQFSFAFNFARTKSQRIPRFVEFRGSGAPLSLALEVDRPSYVKRKSRHTKKRDRAEERGKENEQRRDVRRRIGPTGEVHRQQVSQELGGGPRNRHDRVLR